MNVGLYGGTFNPPHAGHKAAGDIAMTQLRLQKLLVMPNRRPPHKSLHGEVTGRDRFGLCQALCAGEDRWEAVDWELTVPGVSYTYQSLASFQRQYPHDERWFICGTDSARTLPAWHDAAQLVKLAAFAFVGRPGEPPLSRAELGALRAELPGLRYCELSPTPFELSSTWIRHQLALGTDPVELLPTDVAAVVAQLGLYRT